MSDGRYVKVRWGSWSIGRVFGFALLYGISLGVAIGVGIYLPNRDQGVAHLAELIGAAAGLCTFMAFIGLLLARHLDREQRRQPPRGSRRR